LLRIEIRTRDPLFCRGFHPGVGGRNLIPDKENPPQDILDWVATFSRYSKVSKRRQNVVATVATFGGSGTGTGTGILE
jgi:hypothetical protein